MRSASVSNPPAGKGISQAIWALSSHGGVSVAGLVEGGEGGGLLEGHLALDVVFALSVQEPLHTGLQGGEPLVPAALEVPAGAFVAKAGVGLGDFAGDLGEHFGSDGGGGYGSVEGGRVSIFHSVGG